MAITSSRLLAQQMTCSHLRDGNGLSVSLQLNSYELTPLAFKGEAMQEISISGILIPNDEGMPNLPCISKFIAVPVGAAINVSVKSMKTDTLHNINIAPALRIQAIPEEPVTDYVKNESVYATNAFYPQNIYNISESTSLRGVNTVLLGITPFQFNPVTKELIVITDIELNVEYTEGTKAYSDPKYRSPWFDPILKNEILNYDVLEDIEYTAKGPKDGTGCEYLIVIPNREDFRPYAEQIKEFRTKQGIYTKIMRLDEMGVTTPAALNQYFHNVVYQWDIPPVAVLLMGDHNTNMALGIPAETIFHSTDYGNCITDNQYADVNGNLLPDMVFSRMAAENTTQMAILVSKFKEYETQPCMDPNYYNNPITALGWQSQRWFQICSEVVGGYWRKMGKTPVRVNAIYSQTEYLPGNIPAPNNPWSTAQNTATVVNYFGPTGTNYIPDSPTTLGNWSGGTPAQVVTAINNGAFALQHRDHGFVNGWGEPAFTSSYISQLTNVGKMTYLFTINCQTGQFDYSSPCFGEVFHRYTYNGQNAGCVGFLGPTQVSYSFVNDVFAWGMYDLFDPTFLPTYGPSYGPANGPYVGYSGNWMPAFGNVAGKYFLYSSSWPYNTSNKAITYQMFTAHSDVFLRLFTEVPQTINVNHAEVISAGTPNFSISANQGTLIALTAVVDGNLVILAKATATGTTQTLTIPATLPPGTIINVVVTGQNYLRYEAQVEVMPSNTPYIIYYGNTIVGDSVLTYISTNSEIAVTLKNTSSVPTIGPLTVTLDCSDPQITFINPSSQYGSIINSNETGTVHFNVTIAHNIPDNKIFPINITIKDNNSTTTWKDYMELKAYAPVLSLEKILVNNSENGSLNPGSVAKLTAIVKNTGGADAFNLEGNIEINNPYITLVCEKPNHAASNLDAGKSTNLEFAIFVDPLMPAGYAANCNLLLNAQYNISSTAPFTLSSVDYCNPGTTNCSLNGKFTSVQLVRESDGAILLNNTDATCVTGGYRDFTNTTLALVPGEQYTLKVKVSYQNNYIRGWIDMNGNTIFDANEQIINNLYCSSAGVEIQQTFTIPQEVTPGAHRFRLRTINGNTSPNACSAYTSGQTHDYTVLIPDIYPSVQNVNAAPKGASIIITWNKPGDFTPVGYNIYRDGIRLNETLIMETHFTEKNLSENGTYVYSVSAVYDEGKESSPKMSNVVCYEYDPQLCEPPVNLDLSPKGNAVLVTWNEPQNMDGILLGYNIYRNDTKLNATELITDTVYRDEELPDGIYTYQVSAVYKHCKESELTDGIEIVYVGINNIQDVAYNIHPNPTTGDVIIEGKGLNRIEIYDVQGRKLLEYDHVYEMLRINLNKFENGVYMVKMYSDTNITITKQLVIMR